MEFWITAAVIGVVIVGGGLAVLLRIKKGSKILEKELEPVEELKEEGLSFTIEEKTEEGCPDNIKRKLLEEQAKIEKDAHKVYLVITNMFKNKNVPPNVKSELDTFIRSYNRIQELKEEIEIYPFSDCDKVFHLKFNFYENLIKETAKKLMVLSKSVS